MVLRLMEAVSHHQPLARNLATCCRRPVCGFWRWCFFSGNNNIFAFETSSEGSAPISTFSVEFLETRSSSPLDKDEGVAAGRSRGDAILSAVADEVEARG